MKKAALIISSVLLIFILSAVYLVFIRRDVYVLDFNPRYQLQVNRASFTLVVEAIKKSPDFRKNLLIIFPKETKTTDRFSATALDFPGGSQVLYYYDWLPAG
jgi:hypothetical protein